MFFGLGAALAAPAIVRAQNIMPVRSVERLVTGRAILERQKQLGAVMTIEDLIRCKRWLQAMDRAQREIEAYSGVPEGYRLMMVSARAPILRLAPVHRRRV
jgi:hypothetical protein